MKSMPLFPLSGVVLFPGALLPLHIFEYRYRRMVADVLGHGRRFGVINVGEDSDMANVGCVAEIIQLEKLSDGRSNILTVGVERFAVVKKIASDDYPRAHVKTFSENGSTDGIESYVKVASTLLIDVMQLMARLNKTASEIDSHIPQDPEDLSFLIASSLPEPAGVKQILLEMRDTDLRLAQEIAILDDFRNRLRALVAIDRAFEHAP
jgi:ATP-dependent Lon protease